MLNKTFKIDLFECIFCLNLLSNVYFTFLSFYLLIFNVFSRGWIHFESRKFACSAANNVHLVDKFLINFSLGKLYAQ